LEFSVCGGVRFVVVECRDRFAAAEVQVAPS
jgi:hypothetical protein